VTEYHEKEWGVPLFDDVKLFEFLCLESLQCGLSWETVMKKRMIFRSCFDDYDYEKISLYNETDIARIMNTEGMLRSLPKIKAVINNAACYIKIRKEFGSFSDYLWAFSDKKVILYDGHGNGRIPASNGLSDRIAKDLKKRGFKFVGSVTVYSFLQSCGVVNDHSSDCACYQRIVNAFPTVNLPIDSEK
jgi:DNA-3-methyladenine glycosylase I